MTTGLLSGRHKGWLYVVLCGLLSAIPLSGQMTPDAPILHFRLPFFGEDGYKTWELRGLSAEFSGEREVEVESAELVIFAGDERLHILNTIRSPLARIELDAGVARGPSSLFVTGPGFEIEGRTWEWSSKQERLRVTDSARVTFIGSLDILN